MPNNKKHSTIPYYTAFFTETPTATSYCFATMESSSTSPTIEQSIQCLKEHLLSSIDQGITAPSAVKVYVSSLHLLCAIKQALRQIAQYGHETLPGVVHHVPFPSPKEIPTIHKLLHDPALIHTLFLCLSTSSPNNTSQIRVIASDVPNQYETSVTGTSSKVSGPSGNIHADLLGNATTGRRKRSMSVETSAMNVKMNAFVTSPKMNSALRGGHNMSQMNKPIFNAQILAATIIYSLLEYYDHWPAPLIQIYADDCFGPRLWVDNKLCTMLTSNLVLSHTDLDDNNAAVVDVDMNKASLVADAYRDYWAKNFDGNGAQEKSALTPFTTGSKTGPTFATFLSSKSHSSSWRKNRPYEHPTVKRPRTCGTTKSNDSESEDDSSSILQSSATSLEHFDDLPEVELMVPNSDNKKRKLDTSTESIKEDAEIHTDNQLIVADRHRRSPRALQADASSLSREPEIESRAVANVACCYPIAQQYLCSNKIRNRYHGENMKAAHDAIVISLIKRLDIKSKQNSSLLQCLPSFMEISGVRKQVAANLAKWLQSPALAGLARSLFISTVNHIKIVDPPLDDDLQVIDSVVGMNLKSNQLNAHIENISAIAKKLPFTAVISHIYSALTKQLMALSAVTATSDHLKMIAAIHRVIPSTLSYDVLASVLLMLLVNPYEGISGESVSDSMGRFVKIQKLRRLVRMLAVVLGASFDGTIMLQSLLSYKVSSTTWSRDDEEDKARLIFQCGTLAIGSLANDSLYPDSNLQTLTMTIRTVLKLMLTYCCTEYGPQFRCKGSLRMIDYFHNGFSKLQSDSYNSSWQIIMKCLLFVEPPESTQMKRFFSCGNDAVDSLSEWEEELPRIKSCYQVGGEVHGDLIWILLKSTSLKPGIDAEMAIWLLETLLIRCSEKETLSLIVHDPKLVWELYNIVTFEPNNQLVEGIGQQKLESIEFPRLAFTGLWWRVTMIALVFCSNSPEKIGRFVWREHPTLQAIIKMMTSKRFRFPTVDCNDYEKNHMKKLDYAAREEERRIAEALFLPPKPVGKLNVQKGARVSRRLQLQQREKEATKELGEIRRRKALLDEAHKKIMIWDPDGPARKPPPESVDMLHAVNDRFNLSHLFQRCIEPDFLLMSIGQTTRDAIERAYDWLIPIVSSLPAVISRLPSSASCLLLLRAYSTAGEEKKQLKELLAPLHQHVTDSLVGLYGESNAVKALDLIMSDMASKNAEKRRCARKVLLDVLLPTESSKSRQSVSLFACIIRILELKYATMLVPDAVSHMFHAAVLEKSAIMPALVMSLQQHLDFAAYHRLGIKYQFPVVLTHLICTRPLVCMEAMNSDVQFFELAINTLHAEFSSYSTANLPSVASDSIVSPIKGEKKVPLPLLKSLCVVLSIWNGQIVSDECKNAVRNIADALLQDDNDTDATKGLDIVVLLDEWISAISLENWIMLSKARCKSIVRRTILSVPVEFLPRILLCSGLSQSSVLTVIRRLGHVDFAQVLGGWNLESSGNKQKMSFNRKLQASIAAYFRLYNISFPTPNLFLARLLSENDSNDYKETTKETQKKTKGMGNNVVGMMGYTSSFLSELSTFEISPDCE